MTKLVLATHNNHKAIELQTFLCDLSFEVLTLNNFPEDIELREDGYTFQDNALQKARIVYEHTKLVSLADDSGLEVFFLNGRPGVFSARYSGAGATDELNNEKLLHEMRGVAPRRRHAQFRSVLALVGEGIQELTEGICPGVLAEVLRGTNGFGYDPIFIPDGFSRTYAELTAEEKNRISHRSRSFEKMKNVLKLKMYPKV
jgi:XTP/dITP diphosphohydrolase